MPSSLSCGPRFKLENVLECYRAIVSIFFVDLHLTKNEIQNLFFRGLLAPQGTLLYMFMRFGKPEHLKETHPETGKHVNSTQKVLESNP